MLHISNFIPNSFTTTLNSPHPQNSTEHKKSIDTRDTHRQQIFIYSKQLDSNKQNKIKNKQ